MASHQTLSGQIKFGQSNLLYIIDEFAKDNECPSLIIALQYVQILTNQTLKVKSEKTTKM